MSKESQDTRSRETPLEFALRFAQTDLRHMREGDRLNLLDDIAALFFGVSRLAKPEGVELRTDYSAATERAGIVPCPSADPCDMTTGELADLQRRCGQLFLSWATSVSVMERARENWNAGRELSNADRLLHAPHEPFSTTFPESFEVSYLPEADLKVMVARGDIKSLFLFVLSLLLLQGGAPRVRVCIECRKRLFVKTGRRRYCSSPCMHRANKRAQRSSPSTKGIKK